MKIQFATIAVLGIFITPLQAQPDQEAAIDRALECMKISDDAERLQCMDIATEALSVTRIVREEAIAKKEEAERENFGLSNVQKEAQKEASIISEAPKAEDKVDDFGSESVPEKRKQKEKKRLQKIVSKVVELKVNRFRKITLTLDNGQVWRQINSDDKIIPINDKKKLYTATVKRSIMGNYRLTLNDGRQVIRVRRIK